MERVQSGAVAALLLGVCTACSCGDETLPCRVDERADGHRYLVCPDGTETILPDERPVALGGEVAGTARLFGRAEAGIEVSTHVAWEGEHRTYEATTDGEGRFRLGAVPPGHRALRFEFPGYVSEVRPALVLPGTLELPEPVTLWAGRLVRRGAVAIEPLPGGRSFLALEGGGELALWDGPAGTSQVLHPLCRGYEVVADRFVFFAGEEDPGKAPALFRFDRSTGERLLVFPEVASWVAAPGGGAAAALVPADGELPLRVWDAATGRIETPAAGVQVFAFGPEGRRLLFAAGSSTVLWDVAAAAGTVAGAFSFRPAFGPTDDLVVLEDALFDAGRERSWSFPPGEPPGFSPDGAFAVADRRPLLELVDLEGGTRESVPCDGEWAFGDEGSLFFVRDVDGARVLLRRDPATGAIDELATGVGLARLAPVPGGRLLFRRSRVAFPAVELWDPVRGVVTLDPLAGPGAPDPAVTPDGAAILHGDGERLWRYDLAAGTDTLVSGDVSASPEGALHPWWGPDGAFALVAGGALSVWEPARGLRALGPGPGPAAAVTFLADGSVLAVRHWAGRAGELVHLDPGGRLRVLAEGVTRLVPGEGGVPGFHSLGRPELDPAVLHRLDLATGETLPLEAEVVEAIFGDGFLAYTTAPSDPEGPRAGGLYLIRDESPAKRPAKEAP